MAFTVLYRWRLLPGRAAAFTEAWSRGTRLIHRWCGSYGARLHLGPDDTAWSYARWPSAESRKRCFSRPEVTEDPCFPDMQACVAERFDEVVLDIVDDQLTEPGQVHPPLTVRTERLLLRPLRIEDAHGLHPSFADPEVMRYWSRPPSQTLDDSLALVARNVGNRDAEAVAITLPEAPDDALGFVVLVDRKPGVAELGFFLRPDVQRRGLAREAVAAMVDHAFDRGVRRVFADTDPDNAPSVRLLQALGFVTEGRLRAAWHTHIGVRDALILSRLATDRQP